jgi:hypothetical protein
VVDQLDLSALIRRYSGNVSPLVEAGLAGLWLSIGIQSFPGNSVEYFPEETDRSFSRSACSSLWNSVSLKR